MHLRSRVYACVYARRGIVATTRSSVLRLINLITWYDGSMMRSRKKMRKMSGGHAVLVWSILAMAFCLPTGCCGLVYVLTWMGLL